MNRIILNFHQLRSDIEVFDQWIHEDLNLQWSIFKYNSINPNLESLHQLFIFFIDLFVMLNTLFKSYPKGLALILSIIVDAHIHDPFYGSTLTTGAWLLLDLYLRTWIHILFYIELLIRKHINNQIKLKNAKKSIRKFSLS